MSQDFSIIGGLPKELLQYEELYRTQQVIRVRLERRKRRKDVTIIEGFDDGIDIKKIASELKVKLACGGTAKNGRIELQGDHRYRVKDELVKMGFPEENILVE